MKFTQKLVRSMRNISWLRFGVKDVLARRVHDPASASGEFEVDFYGLRYAGNFRNFLDWNVFYFGAYSGNELLLFSDILNNKREAVVLDVGGNIGHHSLYFSTIAGTVHAFEPYEKVLSSFRRKVELNNIKNIHIHPFGLGAKDESLIFYTPGDCNEGTGSFVGNDNAGEKIVLPVRNADRVLEELRLTRIDFIKIDVEGFEVDVLMGLERALEKFKPVIFFEWSRNARGLKQAEMNMLPDGYYMYEFMAHLPIMIFFQKPGYMLRKIDGRLPDGNIVAIHGDSLPKSIRTRIII